MAHLDPAELQWFAVYCGLRDEFRAQAELRALGYEVYCPTETKWRSHAGQKTKALYPYFARYLFVGVDYPRQGLAAVRTARGVDRIVGTPEGPMRIPYRKWVLKLQMMEAKGDFDTTIDRTKLELEPGTPIRIIAGPYEGYMSEVVACKDGEERAVIMLRILGSEREVAVPKGDIEKLDDAA